MQPFQRNLLFVLFVLIAIGGFLAISFFMPKPAPLHPLPQIQQGLNIQQAIAVSLGDQIYEKTANPLQDKLPEVSPVENANPIEGIYKNPFE